MATMGFQSNGLRAAASMERTAYTNVRLLDPATGLDAPGTLITENGRIADLGADIAGVGLAEDIRIVDGGGLCLAPGLIDMRVQIREPGEEHKESIATATAAAAAGGVTAMVCLPNTQPTIDDVSVVEFIARRARETGLVKLYAYGAVTRGCAGDEITEMGILSESGVLAFTDGDRAVASSLVMRRALSYARTYDLLIVQHAEDPLLAKGGEMNEGELATRLGLVGTPKVAEVIMVERDLRLAEMTDTRYHVAHVSTAETVDVIRAAKARGVRVTCDTAPPYFLLNENAVNDYRTFAKLSPPLRTEDDRIAIVEGLKDGTIDVIASDHSPQDQDSKRLPFSQAEAGVVGVETLLPLMLTLYHRGEISLLEALGKATAAPADILGLNEGRLQKGAPADLLLFDPNKPWRIDADTLRSKSKNTPFDTLPVQGRAVRTVVGLRTVYELETASEAAA